MPPPSSTQQTDQDLIRACLDGDNAAWDKLLARYNRLIYAIPLRFGLPRMLADEVFQEVCIALLDGLPTLHTKSRLSAWIATVARRKSIDYLRKSRDDTQIDDLEISDGALPLESDMMQLEQMAQLYEALDRLDDRCRNLLEKLFLTATPASYAEISADLAIPTGSIGPTRNRCIGKLRTLVHEVTPA